MKTAAEHAEDHAVRVRVWVTFVLIIATVGMVYMPEGSVWYSFMASMFWVWRN